MYGKRQNKRRTRTEERRTEHLLKGKSSLTKGKELGTAEGK
jgi:hypothetical protein